MPTVAKCSAPSHITKARRFDGFEGMIWLSSSQVLELDDEFEAVDEEEDQRPETKFALQHSGICVMRIVTITSEGGAYVVV